MNTLDPSNTGISGPLVCMCARIIEFIPSDPWGIVHMLVHQLDHGAVFLWTQERGKNPFTIYGLNTASCVQLPETAVQGQNQAFPARWLACHRRRACRLPSLCSGAAKKLRDSISEVSKLFQHCLDKRRTHFCYLGLILGDLQLGNYAFGWYKLSPPTHR